MSGISLTTNPHKRAGAGKALALLLGAGILLGASDPVGWANDSALDPEADFAIYHARIDAMEHAGSPPCPDGHLCMTSFWNLTVTPIEIIAGNPDIGTQTYFIAQSAKFFSDATLLLHAKKNDAGEWHLADRSVVQVAACLGDEAAEDAKVMDGAASDWDVDEEQDRLCFSKFYETME